jgi:hypothetical protein
MAIPLEASMLLHPSKVVILRRRRRRYEIALVRPANAMMEDERYSIYAGLHFVQADARNECVSEDVRTHFDVPIDFDPQPLVEFLQRVK